MAYVAKCEYDAFISYAHVDNQPFGGIKWVTTLKANLETRLNTELGGHPPVKIWMDHEIKGNVPLPEQLNGLIDKSATLILVLSPAYLKSDWCNKEWQRFLLPLIRERHAKGRRIFI